MPTRVSEAQRLLRKYNTYMYTRVKTYNDREEAHAAGPHTCHLSGDGQRSPRVLHTLFTPVTRAVQRAENQRGNKTHGTRVRTTPPRLFYY